MPRLVYVNPNPIPARQETPEDPESGAVVLSGKRRPFREEVIAGMLPHFTAETGFTGLSSYAMHARDISHYLSCALSLEIRPSSDEPEFGDVICHFPVIQEQCLEAPVWEDGAPVNTVMTQSCLKILERLLTFCANRSATRPAIHASAREARKPDVYKKFAVHTDGTVSHHGRARTPDIPADAATYDRLIASMAQVAGDFREMLEDDDPVVQQYAKFSSFA